MRGHCFAVLDAGLSAVSPSCPLSWPLLVLLGPLAREGCLQRLCALFFFFF